MTKEGFSIYKENLAELCKTKKGGMRFFADEEVFFKVVM